MTVKPASMNDIAFRTGVVAERTRVIEYLLEMNVIRPQMFDLPGYVALPTDGGEPVVLDFKPKPGDRRDT